MKFMILTGTQVLEPFFRILSQSKRKKIKENVYQQAGVKLLTVFACDQETKEKDFNHTIR